MLDGMPQDAVHMAFVNQRGCVAVIRTQDEMARVQVLLGDSLYPFGHILPGGTIAQHGLHALADALHRIFRAGAFVVVFGPASRRKHGRPGRGPAKDNAHR